MKALVGLIVLVMVSVSAADEIARFWRVRTAHRRTAADSI